MEPSEVSFLSVTVQPSSSAQRSWTCAKGTRSYMELPVVTERWTTKRLKFTGLADSTGRGWTARTTKAAAPNDHATVFGGMAPPGFGAIGRFDHTQTDAHVPSVCAGGSG